MWFTKRCSLTVCLIATILIFCQGFMTVDNYLKKVIKYQEEIITISKKIEEEGYCNGYKKLHLYIDVNTITNNEIKDFCKRMKIKQILVRGAEKENRFIPSDTTITFIKQYVPIIGIRKEIVVNMKTSDGNFENHQGYGQEVIRINDKIFYFKH
jgi:hypothetical protein